MFYLNRLYLCVSEKKLKEDYVRLVEESDNYRFVDEVKSDMAAFRAMKILEKLNKVSFLENGISKSKF